MPISTRPARSRGGGIPVWRAEDTGEIIDVDVRKQLETDVFNIYGTAITNGYYQYIKDGSSVYAEPNTYYYYVGNHDKSFIKKIYYNSLGIAQDTKTPPQANRIYQPYPVGRFIMLTNNFIEGTLNPVTTQPLPTQADYPKITIVKEALDLNNANLYEHRFNILETQDTLNTLTNRLNTLKLKLTTLKQKPMYSASGQLTFY